MTYWNIYNLCYLHSLLVLLLLAPRLWGQELNAQVKVVAAPQAGALIDQGLVQEMSERFTEFLNQSTWTQEQVKPEEKILCNFLITIQENPNPGVYRGTAQIISARPVYQSDYESILLSYIDEEWNFQYSSGQPLQYGENFFESNLVSMLSFYVHLIIGMDLDSFGLKGGTDSFQTMQNISLIAQQSQESSWSKFGENMQNRYRLMENINSSRMEEFREAFYAYHRKGLDVFYQDPLQARKEILSQLSVIEGVVKRGRGNFPMIGIFLGAKHRELIDIFSSGSMEIRKHAFQILTSIDPSRSEDYRKIIQN
ncbi:MAG: DUF4835 family protein [Cytophagales bacterium]|nr:DUF4835 family protein [Cytophagales bacterium]